MSAVPVAANPFLSTEFLVTVVVLAALLLAGAVVLYAADAWRKRQLSARDPVESLTSFRALYERGEITEAEYHAVRERVAARVRPASPPVQAPGATPVDPAGGDAPPAQPPTG